MRLVGMSKDFMVATRLRLARMVAPEPFVLVQRTDPTEPTLTVQQEPVHNLSGFRLLRTASPIVEIPAIPIPGSTDPHIVRDTGRSDPTAELLMGSVPTTTDQVSTDQLSVVDQRRSISARMSSLTDERARLAASVNQLADQVSNILERAVYSAYPLDRDAATSLPLGEIIVVNGHIVCEVSKVPSGPAESCYEVICLSDELTEYSALPSMIETLPKPVQGAIRAARRDRTNAQRLNESRGMELARLFAQLESIEASASGADQAATAPSNRVRQDHHVLDTGEPADSGRFDVPSSDLPKSPRFPPAAPRRLVTPPRTHMSSALSPIRRNQDDAYRRRLSSDRSIDSIRAEMREWEDRSLTDRKGYYRQLLLSYHPDKRRGSSKLDGDVFQFIQDSRGWFLKT